MLVSLIQGLIAIKGLKAKGLKAKSLKAKGFFRNLEISARREREKTLLLRAPLVAIGAQK